MHLETICKTKKTNEWYHVEQMFWCGWGVCKIWAMMAFHILKWNPANFEEWENNKWTKFRTPTLSMWSVPHTKLGSLRIVSPGYRSSWSIWSSRVMPSITCPRRRIRCDLAPGSCMHFVPGATGWHNRHMHKKQCRAIMLVNGASILKRSRYLNLNLL